MKANTVALTALLAALAPAAPAAMAAPRATCAQIQQALKSGKSEDQAARDLKVPLARVKTCQKQTHPK